MSPSTFEHEMKKFDRQLRLRKAKLGSWHFIERRAKRGSLAVPGVKYGVSVDRFIRDKEGYVLVARLRQNELTKDVLHQLRGSDMWEKRHGKFGADGMFEEEVQQEIKENKRKERDATNKLEDESIEVYDRQMSRQGDVVYPGLKGNVSGVKK